MKIISHRGNLFGENVDTENDPRQIDKVISLGYDVEVDVWFFDDSYYLGHDRPTYKIDNEFLEVNLKKLWVHAKNIQAVERLLLTDLNWFFHESDKLTLTSKGVPWCFPDVYVRGGVTVVMNDDLILNDEIFGICTDYPEFYKMGGL